MYFLLKITSSTAFQKTNKQQDKKKNFGFSHQSLDGDGGGGGGGQFFKETES